MEDRTEKIDGWTLFASAVDPTYVTMVPDEHHHSISDVVLDAAGDLCISMRREDHFAVIPSSAVKMAFRMQTEGVSNGA